MSDVDFVILAVVAISALISFMRGFVREALSLGTWLAAILITLMFTSRIAILLPLDSVESPQARATVSAFTLFVGTLLLGNLINWMVRRILGQKTLGMADRAVGAVFGTLRGALMVTLLILGAHLVPELKQESWWRDSSLVPRFQKMARFVHVQLPDGIGQHFDFTSTGL